MPYSDSQHPATPIFLHGLDSSIQGTKARWFRLHFPQVQMQNYAGELSQRLTQLEQQVAGMENLILVGSSFGGLMATCFAIRHPEQCRRLVLLAPALNFAEYRPPTEKIIVPTLLVMGRHDTVCPPDLVQPQAEATFSILEVRLEDDDHMLHTSFPAFDWSTLLT
ncbi:MAG: alpha/beta fold hydrolase [Desulfobulbus sp.]|nr:alpha/beta fold hydrolase [Desulfobulbus sp.]